MTISKRLIIIAALSLITLTQAGNLWYMCAQKTTRPGLKAKPEAKSRTGKAAADTIYDCADAVTLRGYDKAQGANSESMFVTNNTHSSIKAVNLTLTYYDMQGHQLHTRTETVQCKLPPDQTVNVSLRAWDRQHLWHYYRTTSTRQTSTPFEVKTHINYIVVGKNQ